MKRLLVVMMVIAGMTAVAATPTVSNVTAKQRYPWNGKVDITYTIAGDVETGVPTWNRPLLSVMATNRTTGTSYTASVNALSGDMGIATGVHHVVWDMNAQGLKFKSDDVVFTVAYTIVPRYCVVDLSEGTNAMSYPVVYMNEPPSDGFNMDVYKTTKLVLRLIEPGSFMMYGRYEVTHTKPFYCGVFEVTQKQYELVTGYNPSLNKGDMRPVERVNWAGSCHPPSYIPPSFVDKMQSHTGLNFELPTSAQWEYACRAGTTSKYNNGGDTKDDLKQLGRYSDNQSDGKGGYSEHTTVGSYLPNAWGLYDMHGNVWEWCSDWSGGSQSDITDPVGPSSGEVKILRGGGWDDGASSNVASSSFARLPRWYGNDLGLRIVRTLSSTNVMQHYAAATWTDRTVLCSCDSTSVAIDVQENAGGTLDSVVLTWDASWVGGDSGATVVIADNGAEIKRTTGVGEFTYMLSGCERHELTYATYVNGVAQDEVYTTTVYTVDAQWKYNVVDSEAVITGTSQKFGATTIPPEVDGYPVTGIAAGAFEGAYWIETVTFPLTLRFVGARAFKDCTGIEEIILPEGVEVVDRDAFRNCTYAQDISLPSTLREIGDGAFANCSQLMTVEIPDGVVEIGEVAFSNCWRMLSASIPCSVTNVGAGAFIECRRLTGVTVPLGLATLAELFPSAYGKIESVIVVDDNESGRATLPMVPGMFSGCGSMNSLTLPEDLAEVSADAFVGCTNMVAFNLPNTVTNIGARAFKDLKQLTEFAFPTGLAIIGDQSFSNCNGINALSLPDGLRSIGTRAFQWVSRLTRVDIPESVESIGGETFYGCTRVRAISLPGDVSTVATIFPSAYNLVTEATVVRGDVIASLFEGCEALANVEIKPGVTTIGTQAFKDCSALVTVEMSSELTAIGAQAFMGCSALTTIGIPSGVTTLGSEAFRGCSNLSQLALPKNLATLPDYVFAECSSLSELVVSESVTSLGVNVFTGCSLLRSVRFVGNAPSYPLAAYDGTIAALVTYVPNGSTGWDGVPTSRALPEFWPDGTTHEITWWEPNRFMVDFVADNGAGIVTTQVEQVTGTTYSLPQNAVRRGAVFGGWWTATDGGARITAVTQVALTRPHTFYAHWTFNQYSVIFDANGGEGTMGPQDLTVSTAASLTECNFSRSGYAFVGWATEPDGEVTYTNAAEVLDLAYEQGASVTLYAVWEEREWTLADFVDCSNLVFSNDTVAEWTPDWEIHKVGGVSLRSGAIEAAAEWGRTNTILMATAVGEGSGSFWWKAHCEEMDDEYDEWYDYAVFTIDGVEVAKIAGDSGWQQVEYTVAGAGPHELAWTFSRDDYDEDGATWENCAWVDGIMWTPVPVTVTFAAGGATEGTAPEIVTKYEGYELVLPGAGTLANGAYVFMGWSDGETIYASGAVYVFGSTNTTLAAVWGEKVWTLGEAVDAEPILFTTGGNADWAVDGSTGWTNGVSAKSGTITSGQTTWIEMTVVGPGTLTYCWNVMGGIYRNTPFAYAKVTVDGTQQVQEYSSGGWKGETIAVEGEGTHVIRWTYMHTSSRTADGDCAWLDAVAWTPVGGSTDQMTTTPEPVPYSYFDNDYPTLLAEHGGDYEAAALATAANGHNKVWECYVAGISPTNETAKFAAKIEMKDGAPVVTWEPNLNTNGTVRIYKVYGSETLENGGDWQYPTNSHHKFFKVTVEMP